MSPVSCLVDAFNLLFRLQLNLLEGYDLRSRYFYCRINLIYTVNTVASLGPRPTDHEL